jgi:hypothetical protein
LPSMRTIFRALMRSHYTKGQELDIR